MDFSTIRLSELKSLPKLKLPDSSWTFQRNPGVNCFLDAPGYPTYFLRHVYKNDNPPRHGATMVITHEDINYAVLFHDEDPDVLAGRLRTLWKPLPWSSERVKLWEREVYRHYACCYFDDARELSNTHERTFIFPVPEYRKRKFYDDPRLSDEQREAAIMEVEAFNADIMTRSEKLATPENACATRRIQGFYPKYEPVLEWLKHPPVHVDSMWWTTDAKRPTIDKCEPRDGIGHETHEGSGWCQWCGWRGEPA